MKKTLLFLSLLISVTAFSQFGSGTVTLKSGYTMKLDINGTTNMTTLTLVGPSNVWMAVGFGGSFMADGADVFRTDGTTISDAKASFYGLPPEDASQDWSLVSNDVNAGVRTIVVTRANNTGDSDDFTFTAAAGSISMIWAHGTTTNYQQHLGSDRGATVVSIGSTLGIPEAKRLDFSFYPNPSSEEVFVQVPTGTVNAKVSLFDYTGRLIKTKDITDQDNKIDIARLSNGIYIMRVESDNKVGAKRLIKR